MAVDGIIRHQKRIKVQMWVANEIDVVAKAVARLLILAGAEQTWGPPPCSARERRTVVLAELRKP
jgi:hypothetical protein